MKRQVDSLRKKKVYVWAKNEFMEAEIVRQKEENKEARLLLDRKIKELWPN